MATTLEQIRFTSERYVKDTIESEDIINWSNDAQADFALGINLPATAEIQINTTDIEYSLPADLRSIYRMRMQSKVDQGFDSEYLGQYRIFNGSIIFPSTFTDLDTILLDYYKHLTHFTDITDTIDLDDRYAPLYTSYVLSQYYTLPQVKERIGEPQARQESQMHLGRYMGLRTQILSLYAVNTEPTVIRERW